MHSTFCSFRPVAQVAAAFLALVFTFAATHQARADIASTWDGATANWTSVAHWSTNPVFPNNATPNFFDVTINAGAVTLDQNIQINQLSLGGGTLDGTFSLSAAEGLQWTAGTIGGSGTLTLGVGGTSHFSSPGTLVLKNRTIAQKGAATFDMGTIRGGFGATISNELGATFTALDQAAFFADPMDPAWTFDNAGSFIARATSGAGFTSMDATFNNSGTVSVELAGGVAHTLSLAAGGTHSGTFALAADTAIELGGTTLLQTGANFTGAGTVYAAGDVRVGTDLGVPNLNVVFGGFDLGGYNVNVSGAAEFGASAQLALEIGGATAGSYGALMIADTTLLDGELAVSLANAFTPAASDVFSILTATGSISGFFSNVPNDGDRFDTADGLGSFAIDYDVNSVRLTNFVPAIIPEPHGGILIAAWLPVMLSIRLRRRIRS